MPLATKIFVALVLGAGLGGWAHAAWGGDAWLVWTVDHVAVPLGQIFLRLLFMVVVPLVFTTLAGGVARLGGFGRLGPVGIRTIVLFLCTTGIAVVLGLLLVNLVQPGLALEPSVRTELADQEASHAAEQVEAGRGLGRGVDAVVNLVPRNPVEAAARGELLPLIVFTLLFGLALTRVPPESARPVQALLDGVARAVDVMIGFAMRLAPLGVFALVFTVTVRFGYGLLGSLGLYVATVLGGLALHLVLVLGGLARWLAGVTPWSFLRRARAALVTAFSTSSSNATLPTTVQTAERKFGVPPAVAGFVLPLGATLNMNGTALFEGVTVLFLAQAFGVEMGLATQALVVGLVVITAIGAAGVPGGSIPLLVMILDTVGVPAEGIGIVLGVDRLLDMARTVPNVAGDLFVSLAVARAEGVELLAEEPSWTADEGARPDEPAVPAEAPIAPAPGPVAAAAGPTQSGAPAPVVPPAGPVRR